MRKNNNAGAKKPPASHWKIGGIAASVPRTVYHDADQSSIADYLKSLYEPGQALELRILSDKGFKFRGVYDDFGALESAANVHGGKNTGVYVTLNPVSLEAVNGPSSQSAADHDVTRRRYMLIDIDSVRPSGASATGAELGQAARVAGHVRDYLADQGWPLPVENMSGNGHHLIYRVDLPASDNRVPKALSTLSELFSDEGAKIDTSVANPGRICRLPGTLARKGPADDSERPHRLCQNISMPSPIEVVTEAQLDGLIGVAGADHGTGDQADHAPDKLKVSYGNFSITDFIQRHFPAAKAKDKGYAQVYELKPCPFNPEHNRGEAHIGVMANGAIYAGCHHDSCTWSWRELRQKYEPKAYLTAYAPAGAEGADQAEERGPYTDSANGRRLAEVAGHDHKYVLPAGYWIYWDGRRWEIDVNRLKVRAAADKAVRGYYDDLKHMTGAARDALFRHANASLSTGRKAAMITAAEEITSMQINSTALDSDFNKLNCLNGTLDLLTGELKPHDRADFITKLTPVNYDPEADAGPWAAFLNDIFNGDQALVDYLRKWAGYSLSGDTCEDKLIILYGKGRNGKGCVMAALNSALGEYFGIADFSTFVRYKEQTNAPRHDLADLFGTRLVSASEGESSETFAGAQIKQLTGGAPRKCRRLYQEFFTYKPQFKIWLDTNHLPRLNEQSPAMKARMCVVPFNRQYGGEGATAAADHGIRRRIEAGAWAEGILKWCVEGFKLWQAEGLTRVPRAVDQASAQYFDDNDKLAEWLEDNCEVGAGREELLAALYADYSRYCEQAGIIPAYRSSVPFQRDLTSRGKFTAFKVTKGKLITGLTLKAAPTLLAPE